LYCLRYSLAMALVWSVTMVAGWWAGACIAIVGPPITATGVCPLDNDNGTRRRVVDDLLVYLAAQAEVFNRHYGVPEFQMVVHPPPRNELRTAQLSALRALRLF